MSNPTATVLLLEPDRVLAQTYRTMLTNQGLQVLVTHHAQDAVACADAVCPDVVVADLQLGQHNGLEFLYEFRSYAEWQNVPVVVLTSVPPHNLRITRQHMDHLGIFMCLYKPATTLLTLRQVVLDALAQPVLAAVAE